MPETKNIEYFREQHKQRLSYMPWLYWSLKPHHLSWARAWQREWQNHLCEMETVHIKGECFIAPEACLFAEPGRPIVIEKGCFIAAHAVLHGPIHLNQHVAINHHAKLDGGRKGIQIGEYSRLAAYCHLYAFNHGQNLNKPFYQQAVSSEGIEIGKDVWIGANVGITDGVCIGDHAIIGMDSTVTKNVEAYAKVAGNPARVIGDRRDSQ